MARLRRMIQFVEVEPTLQFDSEVRQWSSAVIGRAGAEIASRNVNLQILAKFMKIDTSHSKS